ncbi:MAG: SH3 domain-containing protein [Deltaproteobacteria bacterium]|nr:SH3 domain-containing protein [Candidatus Zymogenaceae bacterium]
MKRLQSITVVLGMVLFLAPTVGVCLAAPDVITIDMAEAYMLEGPGVEYPISCKITDDDPLTVVSHQGDWLEVKKSDGVTGWINRVLLSPEDKARYPGGTADTSPGNSNGSLLDDIRTGFSANGDPDLTASAGTRGIDSADGAYGRGGKDYRSVQYMESFYISENELDGFIREGGLLP